MKNKELTLSEKIQILKKNGWILRTQMSLIKNSIEIFFDNSHEYEIYHLKKDHDNFIFKGRINSEK